MPLGSNFNLHLEQDVLLLRRPLVLEFPAMARFVQIGLTFHLILFKLFT